MPCDGYQHYVFPDGKIATARRTSRQSFGPKYNPLADSGARCYRDERRGLGGVTPVGRVRVCRA